MILIANKIKDISYAQIMRVYAESNRLTANQRYLDADYFQGILLAEQDLYQYLRDSFFTVTGAFCVIWEEQGNYVSALRMEPYQDGYLIESLETVPEERRKGYAKKLIHGALDYVQQNGCGNVYVHIANCNHISYRTHLSCGFEPYLRHAVLIDGSVSQSYVTLRYPG